MVQVVRRPMPDYEADVRRRPVVRLVEGCAAATQGNEFGMTLRKGPGRGAYRSQEGDDEQHTLNLFHATTSKAIPRHYCVELPSAPNICGEKMAPEARWPGRILTM